MQRDFHPDAPIHAICNLSDRFRQPPPLDWKVSIMSRVSRRLLEVCAAVCFAMTNSPAIAQQLPATNLSQSPLAQPTPAGVPSVQRLPTSAPQDVRFAPGEVQLISTNGVAAAQRVPADLVERLEAAEAELAELRAAHDQPKTLTDRLAALEERFRADKDKLPLIRLSGVFQLDYATFKQDGESLAMFNRIPNGVGFRRARLKALGNVTEQTRYTMEFDFAAAGRPSFTDVWGEQQFLPYIGNARIGQYIQPITMDGATNFRHLDFMEYSQVFNAFDPFRRVGVMSWFNSDDEMSYFAASFYGTGFTFYNGNNPFDGNTVYNSLGGDNRFGTTLTPGASIALRATHLLYYDDLAEGRYLMHVGAGFNYSQIGGHGTTGPDAQAYQARTIPGVFVGDPGGGGVTAAGTPFTLDTGRFRATDFSIYHLEWAANYGSAHFQTEYVATVVNQANGGLPVFLDGVYAQAGYFLTGESVGYNKQNGTMDYNVKPNSQLFGLGRHAEMCGWGAWEVAARYDFLDLRGTKILAGNIIPNPTPVPPSPGAGLVTQIPGTGAPNPGFLNMGTFALNWWWNEYTRVQFEYIYAANQSNTFGHNAMSIGAARFQVEF